MGDTNLVSKFIANVNSESVPTFCYSQPTLITTQQSVSSSKQEKHVSLRLRCIKHQLKNKSLSRKSIQYIKQSWRISTNRKYEFIWDKWHIWCSQREINPMQPTEIDFIQYLSELPDKKNHIAQLIHIKLQYVKQFQPGVIQAYRIIH